jgi:hypothetical protein
MAILSVSNLQVVPGIQFQLRTIGNKIEPDAGRRAVCCRGRFPRRGMQAEAVIDPTRDAKLWKRESGSPSPIFRIERKSKGVPETGAYSPYGKKSTTYIFFFNIRRTTASNVSSVF